VRVSESEAIEYTDVAMNLKSYFPDFVIDDGETHRLLEAKGQENIEVIRKDAAALRWCENASKLTETAWRYVKVPQKDYGAPATR
jgi:type III restriction enzyme